MYTSCSTPARVLIADDQSDILDALRLLLKSEGMHMDAATSPDATVAALSNGSYDLLLMDLNYRGDTTSGAEGIDLLSRIQAIDSSLPVVVMTGWGSVDLAVETMRRGVRDFVQKPWENSQLLATLRSEIAAGRERRRQTENEKRELEEARRIQRRLLPTVVPRIEGCEIATRWQPASGVGGDCYDVITFTPSRLGVCIADVVGKGIPAALLMSNLQASVRAFATELVQPAELCQQVNRILCGCIAEGRFISFFFGRIDTTKGVLTYANAGHYLPIVVRPDGSVTRLGEGGPVLGVFGDAEYAQADLQISSGDRIILFTDGVTEARDAFGEEFGEERLIEAAIAHRACSAPDLEARLSDCVASFTGDALQDDATLIVVAVDQASRAEPRT